MSNAILQGLTMDLLSISMGFYHILSSSLHFHRVFSIGDVQPSFPHLSQKKESHDLPTFHGRDSHDFPIYFPRRFPRNSPASGAQVSFARATTPQAEIMAAPSWLSSSLAASPRTSPWKKKAKTTWLARRPGMVNG